MKEGKEIMSQSSRLVQKAIERELPLVVAGYSDDTGAFMFSSRRPVPDIDLMLETRRDYLAKAIDVD